MEMGKQRFSADKPVSCKYCYFWLGKVKGCKLENCYYLLTEEPPPDAEEPSRRYQRGNCDTCPYGRASPCVGFCIEKIMMEWKASRES